MKSFKLLLTTLILLSVQLIFSQNTEVSQELKVESITFPGRDYSITSTSRQQIVATNDLLTYAGGHIVLIPSTLSSTNRGVQINDPETFETFFYAHPDTKSIGIGIGGDDPKAKLHIKGGQVYIEDPNEGVILKSTGGFCFKITVDDTGVLTTTPVSPCP